MTALNIYDQQRIKGGDSKWMTLREKEKSKVGDVSLFDWINYMMFLPSCYAGPPLEYVDVNNYLNCKGNSKWMPSGYHILPALKRFSHALIMMVIQILLANSLDREWLMTEEFGNFNLFFKSFYLIACMMYTITQLQTVFLFLEAGIIASGIGYQISHVNIYN